MHIDTYHRVVRAVDLLTPQRFHAPVVPAVAGWAMRRVPDRRLLERRILPGIAAARHRRVLFVGTSRVPDTRTYHLDYPWGDTEFWTMDKDPEAAAWGGDRHWSGDICAVSERFPAGWFDCVLLNGVLGWGVDTGPAQELALEQCREVLSPGGLLVVGWNTSKCADPLRLSAVARHFERTTFAGLPARCEFAETDHVLDFLSARRTPPGGPDQPTDGTTVRNP
ncbi:class I SAM-dependent methyltransferase [Saccharothrix luteola]|uniref:class I SAM-dependent methyltransferase n=1 Tax=Saccharothrix luteola TaxID=2893018 RepID=UPI001E59637F|nr:class I SAM-dependent methyltransferase [Saccharothrix luteola]MCC8243022.1 hypothetical protein [Saccharothrix luteola]